MKLQLITLIILFSSLIPFAHATDYEYPELLVSPSASKRVLMEAQAEPQNNLYAYLTIQIPALLNLANAILINPNDDSNTLSYNERNDAKRAGMTIGAGWIITTIVMQTLYTPYRSTWEKIERMPAKDKNQALIRERIAEEGLETPSRIATRLAWISAITNALAAGAMANKGDNTSKILSGLAFASSISPFIFESRWSTVYNKHQDYKKRIYGPITMTSLVIDPTQHQLLPGFGISTTF